MILDNNVVGTWVSDRGKYLYFPYFVVVLNSFLWSRMAPPMKEYAKNKCR